ncbi:MAG: right-handed parallel beta-helix repeat-containing protein [Myxococcales bacterium]|nr:right-handed parallel beta-helix repeat-containing protein [Myxococcales bacterium]MCB9579422.1 right-handed parallel beta-helix repeat-containing protein [Polyangiaceae bacterium]
MRPVLLCCVVLLVGCSSENGDGPPAASSGGAAGSASGGSAGTQPSDGGFPSGGSGGAAGMAGSSGSGASAGAGGSGGDPNFTADGCFKWTQQNALQAAVDQNDCVEVQPGTWLLDATVAMKPGHTLRGVSAAESILKANAASWSFGCCDSMVGDTLPPDPAANPFKVQKLTLDGSGVATYNVCCRGYLVEDSVLKNNRCSAIGAAGTGVTAKNNQMLYSAQPTSIPGKGTVSCATGGFGGVAEGAAIYSEAKAANFGTVIDGNVIKFSFGPALDVNGAWGGTFTNNQVSDNTAWAAVSLYGASNWKITNNVISHPGTEPPQPYHPYCATGPSGGHSAGIFLCQDTDQDNLVVNGNTISGNKTSSFYGILSVGADELKPYWAPRNNTFTNNDVFGSNVGCADDFSPGQWQTDKNTWTGNNCAGAANTPPNYF